MSHVPASAQSANTQSANAQSANTQSAESPVSAALLSDGFGRVAESVPRVLDGLSAAELAWQPAPAANSVGWLVWHLARVEDAQIAPLAERAQVRESGWAERLGVPYAPDDTGYGHTPDQVAAFAVDGPALAAYYAAVHAQTLEVVDGLSDDDYARIVDRHWDPPVTCAVRIVSVLDDVARHVGQAEYVRGLLQRR